mgnify:CR=1 FL=1
MNFNSFKISNYYELRVKYSSKVCLDQECHYFYDCLIWMLVFKLWMRTRLKGIFSILIIRMHFVFEKFIILWKFDLDSTVRKYSGLCGLECVYFMKILLIRSIELWWNSNYYKLRLSFSERCPTAQPKCSFCTIASLLFFMKRTTGCCTIAEKVTQVCIGSTYKKYTRIYKNIGSQAINNCRNNGSILWNFAKC